MGDIAEELKGGNGALVRSASSSSSLSSNSSESDRESDYPEEELDSDSVKCLFCEEIFTSSAQVFQHCIGAHGFNFNDICKINNLDYYGAIRLINYVRSCVKSGKKVLPIDPKIFKDDSFLVPVLENDSLCADIQIEEEDRDKPHSGSDDIEKQLSDLKQAFAQYKAFVSNTLREKETDTDKGGDGDEARKAVDAGYFEAYGFNDIHETMLKDTVRTDGYRDFIYENKDIFKDKVVLDVGCGTGILSMFSAKAGAKRVFSVDKSQIIDKAISNVFENALDDKITCIRGKIEDIQLEPHSVDILISEWMGYGLLYEAMLDSVLYARDKFLKADGLMAPSECRLFVAGMNDESLIDEKVDFWNEVYGFKMSSMRKSTFDDAMVDFANPETVFTDAYMFKRLELHTCKLDDLIFTAPFTVTNNSSSKQSLSAFVIWFDTYFVVKRDLGLKVESSKDLEALSAVSFTTGPFGTKTHWKQVILMIDGEPLKLEAGDKVSGTIEYKKGRDGPRSVDIKLKWKDVQGDKTSSQYYMLR